MIGDELREKAAQLMVRARGEEMLMRAFYESLARSYSHLAWEADRLAERADMKRKTANVHELLAQMADAE